MDNQNNNTPVPQGDSVSGSVNNAIEKMVSGMAQGSNDLARMSDGNGERSAIIAKQTEDTEYIKIIKDDEEESGSVDKPEGYNTAHVNADSLGQTVADTAKNQFTGTDAYQGYSEMSHKAELFGLSGPFHSAARDTLQDRLYNDTHNFNYGVTNIRGSAEYGLNYLTKAVQAEAAKYDASAEAKRADLDLKQYNKFHTDDNAFSMKVSSSDMTAIFGDKYIVSSNRTGDMMADYKNNVSMLEKYLYDNNINASKLSVHEIQEALLHNRFKSGGIHGAGVKFNYNEQNLKDPTGKSIEQMLQGMSFNKAIEMRKVIAEYGYLKSQEGVVSQIKSTGRLKATMKAWVNEAYGQTDAAKGLHTAKTVVNTAKAAGWAAKGVAGAGVGAGSLLIEKELNLTDKVRLNRLPHDEKFSTNAETIRKRMADRSKSHKQFRQKKNEFVKTSATQKVELQIKNAESKIVEKTGLKKIKAKVAQKKSDAKKTLFGKILDKAGKAVKSPFKAINAASIILTKAKLYIGLAILAIIVLCGAFICFMQALVPSSSVDDEYTTKYSNMQKAIDYLYDYQKAYTNNISKADINSIYIDKGIPSSWRLVDEADTNGTDAISGEMTAVYKNGVLKGYNLSHYWGPKDRTYEGTVQVGEEVTTTQVNPNTGENEDVTSIEYTDTPMIIQHGIAGIGLNHEYSNDIGTYGPIESGDGGKIIADIQEDSQGYADMPNEINQNVTVDFEYAGSEYSYKLGGKSTDYITQDGSSIQYDIEPFYKAFCCMSFALTSNYDENYAFYEKYMKQMFDRVMEHAQVTLKTEFVQDPNNTVQWTYNDTYMTNQIITAPAWTANVTLKVWIKDAGIQDIMALDTADNDFVHNNGSTFYMNSEKVGGNVEGEIYNSATAHTWLGWYDITAANQSGLTDQTDWRNLPSSDYTPMSDAMDMALSYYELDDEDFEEFFPGLQMPGDTADAFSDEDIEQILSSVVSTSGISADGNRGTFCKFALSCVGQFYYKYGGGHGGTDADNPPAGLDCSGFVSYACYKGGVDSAFNPRGACGFIHSYKQITWNGDWNSIKPGTIIVKNNTQGGSTTSSNHVVIYIGCYQAPGDTEPVPHCVECTTSTAADGHVISGVQISSAKRMKKLATYKYAVDPFPE